MSFRVIHWLPSWLILQITLAVYREVVVLIYYFIVSFERIMNNNFKIYGSIGLEIQNSGRQFVVAMCTENNQDAVDWKRSIIPEFNWLFYLVYFACPSLQNIRKENKIPKEKLYKKVCIKEYCLGFSKTLLECNIETNYHVHLAV